MQAVISGDTQMFFENTPTLIGAIRSFMVFSAAFGGAYGFIVGSRSEQKKLSLDAQSGRPTNVIAVRMPYRTSSPDSLAHAQLVIDQLGVEVTTRQSLKGRSISFSATTS